MIVVIIQATLPYGDGAPREELSDGVEVASRIERGGVVRMYARGREDESRVRRRERGGSLAGIDRFADADHCPAPGIAQSRHHRIAVVVERRISEVRVAVDEPGHVRLWIREPPRAAAVRNS